MDGPAANGKKNSMRTSQEHKADSNRQQDNASAGYVMRRVTGGAWNVEYCLAQRAELCIIFVKNDAGVYVNMEHSATPFIDDGDEHADSPQGTPCPGDPANGHACPWCFNMFEPRQEDERRCGQTFAHGEPSSNSSPFSGVRDGDNEFGDRRLNKLAAAVLMEVLDVARRARRDLLNALISLATQLTKWDERCDRKLHRLMWYSRSTTHMRQVGWVGDDYDSIDIHLFTDTDFAGCAKQRNHRRQACICN